MQLPRQETLSLPKLLLPPLTILQVYQKPRNFDLMAGRARGTC